MSDPLCFGVERGEIGDKLDPFYYKTGFRYNLQAIANSAYPSYLLGDILEDIHYGAGIPPKYSDKGILFIRAMNIRDGRFDLSSVVYLDESVHSDLDRYRLQENDLVMVRSGVNVGDVCRVPARLAGSVNGSYSITFRVSQDNNPKYVSQFLNSRFGRLQVTRVSGRSAQPNINSQEICGLRIVIPPRSIQDAIADKMDAAYRRKRELEAEAETLRESIDGYVLGELGIELPELTDEKHFAGWANETRGGRLDTQYYQPGFVTAFNLLANLKNVKTVGDVAHLIRNGADIRDYLAEGTPYLRVGDIKGGSIVLDKVKFVAAVPDNIPESKRVRAGDALFTRKGSYGNVAAVKQEHESCIISSELIRIVLDQSIDADYFAIVMNSPVGKLQSERNAVGAVMPGISHPVLKTFKIPLTSSTHQYTIIAEVQHRQERAAALQEEAKRVLAEARAEVERMILG